jgi:TolA-binding protein
VADRYPRSPAARFGILPAALLAAALLQGCSAPGFVRRPVDNFRAYYNTFYNAKKAYTRGVEGQPGAATTEAKVERLRYVSIFTVQSEGRASTELEAAILKSADVLRDHPNSKWVDDALLLIGKSYFHQRNLVGAEQKFREVIELESGLEDEARFWLARTLIAAERYGEAEAAIDEALAREDVAGRWESMLRLAKGDLRVQEQAWEDAAVQLESGLEDVPEAEFGARAQYLLGQVLETLGRYPEAVRAYRDVRRFRPTYEWSYAAQFSAVRVEGLHVDGRRAVGRLRGMERDDKNYAYRAELLYLRGLIAKSMGRADDAWRIFDDLLYDEAYVSLVGDLRGRIHYALGELYRDLDRDFVLAAAHFDTAAAQLRSQLTRIGGAGATSRGGTNRPDERWAPEATLDAEKLKEAFGAFAEVRGRVARMDSLLVLGALGDEAFETRILEIRQQMAREMEEERRRQEALAVQQAFARGASGTPDPSTGSRGNRPSAQNQQANVAGFLFHRDAVQAQEGLLSFQRTWGDRPLVRNWRRIDAVSRLPEQELVDEFSDGAEREEERPEDALPEVDVGAVPRDSTSLARMHSQRAAARYELANSLFLGMGRPDSAAHWYRLVLDESGEGDLSRRALFALAEVQQALGDSAAARAVYDRIVRDHPDSEFADRGRLRMGLPSERVEVPDSVAVAEEAYARQYEAWGRGEHRWALGGMIHVAAEHAVLPVRPRSLLAAGLIFTEWAATDSLDLLGPIPLRTSDSLLIDLGLITPPVVDSVAADAGEPAVPEAGLTGDAPGNAREAEEALERAAVDEQIPDARRRRPIDDRAAPDTIRDRVADPDAMPPGGAPDSAGVTVDSVGVAVDSTAAGLPGIDSDPDRNSERDGGVGANSLVAGGDSLASLGAIAMADAVRAGGIEAPEPPVDPDAWRILTLEKLLAHIRDRYGETPYAGRAGEMLAGLEEKKAQLVRIADSLAALAALRAAAAAGQDSVAVAGDSLGLTVDSLAVQVDSLGLVGFPAAEQPSAGAEEPVPDSIAAEAELPGVARPPVVEPPPAEVQEDEPAPDTLARDIELPGVADPVVVEPPPFVVDGQVPARDTLAVGDPVAIPGVSGDAPAADTTAAPGADEAAPPDGPATWREVATSEARPLYDVESTLDTWLVVLEEVASPTMAPPVFRRFRETLSGTGTIEMVTGTLDGEPVVYVVLGRFDSRGDAERAVSASGDLVPEGAWFLHVLPR